MLPPLPIQVSQQIRVPKARLGSKTKKFLREKLFIPNSEYIIKERLGKPTYNVPKFFDLIEEDGPDWLLPRGFLGPLTDFLKQEGLRYEVTHRHPAFTPRIYESSIRLRDEQVPLLQQAFAAGSGVIVAPPGSGKTVMGLELIARHQMPALILTHRKQLLDQWMEHIQTHLMIPKKHIGRYSSAYKKPGQSVTVGLLQTFARMEDLAAFTEQFGVIIVDECHHIPAKTFRTVVSALNATHIYGLTATPKRKHNDERLIYFYIGDIVATMPTDHRTSSSGFKISVHETPLRLPFDWKKDQSELLAKVICYDTGRNQQIIKDIKACVEQGRKILVLSERKEHLAVLALYLRGACETIVFSGDDSARQRLEKLHQINAGDYQVLLATGQIFGEGIHISTIECLVLAFPFAFEGKLVQYVGRLLHSPLAHELIDYRDPHVTVLEEQFKKRKRYYDKIQAA